MNNIDWDFLIEAIQNGKCILFIGEDLYHSAKYGPLKEHLRQYLNLDPTGRTSMNEQGLFSFQSNSAQTRTYYQIRKFFNEAPLTETKDLFSKIAQVPVPLVVSMSPDHMLQQQFEEQNLPFNIGFHWRRQPAEALKPIGNTAIPLIYNFVGSTNQQESLVLSMTDRFDFFESIYQNPLPNEIRSFIRSNADFILLLGLNFEDWFTQFSLHAFDLHNDWTRAILGFSSNTSSYTKGLLEQTFGITFSNLDYNIFLRELVARLEDKGLLKNATFGQAPILDKLKELVAENRIEELLDVLNLLLEETNEYPGEIEDDINLIANRWRRLQRKIRQGLLSDQDRLVEENRIRTELIDLINRHSHLLEYSSDPTILNILGVNTVGLEPSLEKEHKSIRQMQEEYQTLLEQLKTLQEDKAQKEERIKQDTSESKSKRFAAFQEKEAVYQIHKELEEGNLKNPADRRSKRAQKLEEENELQDAITLYESAIEAFENFIPAWEGLERIYRKLGDEENRLRAAQQVRTIREVYDFEKNSRQKVIIQQLSLNSIANYSDFEWVFNPRMNILLGKNGYGKSHLLRLIIALLQNDEDISSIYFQRSAPSPTATLQLDIGATASEILRTKTMFQKRVGRVPILAIPDLRFVDRNQTSIRLGDQSMGNFRENGALHFLQQIPYESFVQSFLYELCIEYLAKNDGFNLEIFKMIENVVQELTDSPFKFHKIEAIGNAEFIMEVLTEGNSEPLPIQYASQGTLSILSTFGLIFNYLKAMYPNVLEDEVSIQTGNVIIDEIDAHLHPSWQRKVISLLRQHFPNVQFIITAHSPLVVGGSREGEVAVLRKEATVSGFFIEKYEEDFIGEEFRDILQDVFQVQEEDETFTRYMKLLPQKEELKSRIIELSNLENITPKEKNELNVLMEDYYYLLKFAKENL